MSSDEEKKFGINHLGGKNNIGLGCDVKTNIPLCFATPSLDLTAEVTVKLEPELEELSAYSNGSSFPVKIEKISQPCLVNEELTEPSTADIVCSTQKDDDIISEADEFSNLLTSTLPAVEGPRIRILSGDQPYGCSQCEGSFKNRSAFKNHIFKHKLKKTKITEKITHARDQCESESRYKPVIHNRKHRDKKVFVCDQCESKFTQRSRLVRHVRSHTGEKPPRPYACDQCESRFAERRSLVRHVRLHTGEKPFICGHCDSRFTDRAYLASHIRTHTGEKPFACDQCDSKFAVKSNLRDHMRVHTGERPFGCDQCERKFTARRILIKHMRVHTEEKPFDCDQCGRKFARRQAIIQHMRTHTGEKPFSCDECERKFTRQSGLLKHKRVHTVKAIRL